jgi:hypothetical protein
MKFQNLSPIPFNYAFFPSLLSFFPYTAMESIYRSFTAIYTDYTIPINASAPGYIFNPAS